MNPGRKVLRRSLPLFHCAVYSPAAIGIDLEAVRSSCSGQQLAFFIKVVAFFHAVLVGIDPVPAVCGVGAVSEIVFPLVRSSLIGPCSCIGGQRVDEQCCEGCAEAGAECIFCFLIHNEVLLKVKIKFFFT